MPLVSLPITTSAPLSPAQMEHWRTLLERFPNIVLPTPPSSSSEFDELLNQINEQIARGTPDQERYDAWPNAEGERSSSPFLIDSGASTPDGPLDLLAKYGWKGPSTFPASFSDVATLPNELGTYGIPNQVDIDNEDQETTWLDRLALGRLEGWPRPWEEAEYQPSSNYEDWTAAAQTTSEVSAPSSIASLKLIPVQRSDSIPSPPPIPDSLNWATWAEDVQRHAEFEDAVDAIAASWEDDL